MNCPRHFLLALLIAVATFDPAVCLSAFSSGAPQSRIYLYAHGNPINRVDPSGRESLVSVNMSAFIVSQLALHELRGANAALKGARTLFGADDMVNNLIFGMDVIDIVDEKVGQIALGAGAVVGSLRLYSWIRNTVGSSTVARGVLESLSNITKLFPSKTPKPIQPESSPYLYRVIFPQSQDYNKFAGIGIEGSVTPRGGHNDVMRHLLSDTESIFTSWSKDPQGNWSRWSGSGAIQIRVDARKLQNPGLDVTELAGSDEFLGRRDERGG